MPESSISAGDTAWLLASAALVMIMTPGLAFFYGGMVRQKNTLATIMQSFSIVAIVSVVWVLWGYSLAFGPDRWGFIGSLDWIGLKGVGVEPAPLAPTVPHQAYMIFQGMFAVITPALITGAFAERVKFSTFLIFTVVWVTVVYAPVAHWVWGGGWLAKLGALDFAGGTVVHISSGVSALAAALVLGKRLGYGRDPMEPHDITMTVLGAAILWFGWFGFNAGSALTSGALAANAFVVTHTAAAAGAISWMGMSWYILKKPSVLGAASGAVAGLVAITPASGFVGPMPAVLIGLVAGILCFAAVQLRLKLGFDDSLDVWGVHGIGGTWGALATGLFLGVGAAGLVSVNSGVGEQFMKQLYGVLATWGYAFVMTLVIIKVLEATVGLRVKADEEEAGLDLTQHGEPAYRL